MNNNREVVIPPLLPAPMGRWTVRVTPKVLTINWYHGTAVTVLAAVPPPAPALAE